MSVDSFSNCYTSVFMYLTLLFLLLFQTMFVSAAVMIHIDYWCFIDLEEK